MATKVPLATKISKSTEWTKCNSHGLGFICIMWACFLSDPYFKTSAVWLINVLPKDAAPIHAPIIKAPWSLRKMSDFASKTPTIPNFWKTWRNVVKVWYKIFCSKNKVSLWLHYDFFGRLFFLYCKFPMPRPLKWAKLEEFASNINKRVVPNNRVSGNFS